MWTGATGNTQIDCFLYGCIVSLCLDLPLIGLGTLLRKLRDFTSPPGD